jgi:RNA-directed DNA polymerase
MIFLETGKERRVQVIQVNNVLTTRQLSGRIRMEETKSVPVAQAQVWEAFRKVKVKKGSAGIDGQSITDFEVKLEDNLYKIWNRLSSGSYFPPHVKEVEIPKKDGKMRKLGIPTIGDRVAQTVVKDYLEPDVDKVFHNSSYGYRPNRSAHGALEEVRRNCWQYDWVIDLDIKGFFDNIDHELMLKALTRHADQKWVLMYVRRWLETPIEKANGEVIRKEGKGTPQGGVISPLLANLFLHYAFDKWFTHEYPRLKFVRYADDIVVFARTKEETENVLQAIQNRMQECKLEIHPEKTIIVYCKDYRRRGNNDKISFDFLGYTFQPRPTRSKRDGKFFLGFDCGISLKARKKIVAEIRSTKFHRWSTAAVEEIAKMLNPQLRGWINYYGKFRMKEMHGIFRRLNMRLVKWILNRYKSLKNRVKDGFAALKRLQNQQPNLFAHWAIGYKE